MYDMAKIYVSVTHHQYYFHPDDSSWEYEIEGKPEVITILDELFNQKKEKPQNQKEKKQSENEV